MNEEIISLQAESVPHPDGTRGPLTLMLVDPLHPMRQEAEKFVRGVFHKSYGAKLDSFYPLLLCILWGNGTYAAVAGVRPAIRQKLFAEFYLDEPVESTLNCSRDGIVEVGNLAPSSVGQARWLICTVTAFLIGAGYSDVVFTAVARLRNAFKRMGLPVRRLADADPSRLPQTQINSWGTYYQSKPALFSGDLRPGIHVFDELMAINPDLQNISQQAYLTGSLFSKEPCQDHYEYDSKCA